MDFWDRLDWLIKEKGLTRKELSSLVGVSESSISVWKYRKTFPDADVALAVARALGVSVEYLLEGPRDEQHREDPLDNLSMTVRIPNENRELQFLVQRLMECDRDQLLSIVEILSAALDLAKHRDR